MHFPNPYSVRKLLFFLLRLFFFFSQLLCTLLKLGQTCGVWESTWWRERGRESPEEGLGMRACHLWPEVYQLPRPCISPIATSGPGQRSTAPQPAGREEGTHTWRCVWFAESHQAGLRGSSHCPSAPPVLTAAVRLPQPW